MVQSQSHPRDGYTTACAVKDNSHAVPGFYKWVCRKCGQRGNEMKSIKCSRCQFKREHGTVAGDFPSGDMVFTLRQKDDYGNERWEWSENHDKPIKDPKYALMMADVVRFPDNSHIVPQGPRWVCTECCYSKTRMGEMRCRKCSKERRKGTWAKNPDGSNEFQFMR